IVFEIPSNVILKKTRASIWLSSIMLVWGIATVAIAFVTNFAGLFVCRIILGMAQSGYIPGILYQMSLVYKPREVSTRVALLLTMASISGIVSGPIAYGCSFLEGHLGRHGWQYLFIVEGVPTIALSLISFFALFDDIQDVRWLTPEQKALQYIRMNHSASQPHLPITLKTFINVISDYKVYLFGLIYMMSATNHTSFAIFVPTIIKGFGYPVLTSQLLSAPPSIICAIFTLLGGYLSDHFNQCRSILAMVGFGLLSIGYGLLLVLEDTWQLYGVLFIIPTGIGLFVAPVVCWSAVSFPDLATRAVAVGTVVMIGNTGGVIASFLYPYNPADPRHFFGNMFNICVGITGFILTAILGCCLRRLNKRMDQLEQENKIMDHQENNHHHSKNDTQFRYLY
ncbi:major facilitator superfamily domain-containing protein, partial [Cunninghamella echinulata]